MPFMATTGAAPSQFPLSLVNTPANRTVSQPTLTSFASITRGLTLAARPGLALESASMPTIYDNIKRDLLPALKDMLDVSLRADFCVGYFNLRGWRLIDDRIQAWAGGSAHACRLLVGMQRPPEEELRAGLRFRQDDDLVDNKTALAMRKRLAESFRNQLTFGAPTNADEAGLRRLAAQIRDGKLAVKLFLRHPLHAKLYILQRADLVTPIVGYLGSSNLTFAGLAGQGELNIDVVDQDACCKLAEWFEDRWNDRWCVDISEELAAIIDESWAGEPTLALFCSSKAPAGILLAVHDLAQGWRHDGPLLMGGFQSLVEDEALAVLLRGPWPVAVWCARGMAARVRADFKPALAAGRLTLVAPFPDSVRRVTSETAAHA